MEVFDPMRGSNVNQLKNAPVDRYNIFVIVFLSDSGHPIIYPMNLLLPRPCCTLIEIPHQNPGEFSARVANRATAGK